MAGVSLSPRRDGLTAEVLVASPADLLDWFGVVLVLSVPVLTLLFARERALGLLELLLRPMSGAVRGRLMATPRQFDEAVAVLGRPSVLLLGSVLSLCVWALSVGVAWALFGAFDGIHLGIAHAVIVTLFVAVVPTPVRGLGPALPVALLQSARVDLKDAAC